MKGADHPYWNTSQYAAAIASDADVVVLMLGTNDAKRVNWGADSAEAYSRDSLAMISSFRAMPSKARVMMMIPPPM